MFFWRDKDKWQMEGLKIVIYIYIYIRRKVLFADWCKLIFFFYEIVQIFRTVVKRRTVCLNIAQSLKRASKTSSFYSIFAFDVSQFKRKSRRILINFNHTYNNDLFIIKYPSVSYNFNNLIGIYIYISWNCEYVANDTIADEYCSHRVDTYAKIVILFLPYSVVNLNVAF